MSVSLISTCWAAPGGRQFEFNNEEERREAIDHIRETARRKYLGEREVRGEILGRIWEDGIWNQLKNGQKKTIR